MAGSSSSKRKFKRMKRQMGESTDIVQQVMSTLTVFGYPVQFPWEIPHAVADAIQNGPKNGHGSPSGEGTRDRMAAALSGSAVSAPPAPAPAAAPSAPAPVRQISSRASDLVDSLFASEFGEKEEVDAEPEADPWDTLDVDDVFLGSASVSAATPSPQGSSSAPAMASPEGPPMSPEEMKRLVEEKQRRMLERVANTGVRYGRGAAGPAEGQKMDVHPSVKMPSSPAPAQDSPSQEGGYVSPYGGSDDGTPRGKNGMTRAQMVEAIAKATGKPPGEVKPNPNVKPPGF